jgi:hypothetical protein
MPRIYRPLTTAIACALLAAGAAMAIPAAAGAAVSTFGSPLGVPATLDTAENLNYEGAGVALPGSIFRINHDGADTLLWNIAQPQGAPAAPASGQVTGIALEGCARQPAGAPAPLTQIHFQVITPLPGGGGRIDITSGAFDIPVCGAGGASGSTVSHYNPVNLCVSQGDYVAFNDEGGFVPSSSGPPPYPAGVPYMVIGAVHGATMDSFIRNGGTLNGTTMSPSDRTYHDGFATNENEEVLLQSTLATGSDALPVCGGTKGATSGYSQTPSLPPMRIGRQTDGINRHGIAAIAVYCRPAAGCPGTLTLVPASGARKARALSTSFSVHGGTTSHVPVRLPGSLVSMVRHHHKSLPMKLTATVGTSTVVQTIVLKIF